MAKVPDRRGRADRKRVEIEMPPITRLSDRKRAEHVQALLWGPPKVGKTILAHTFPRTRTLDFDNGMESVLTAADEGWIDVDKDEIVYATITEENREEYGYVAVPTALDKATMVMEQWVSDDEYDNWDTLILDSVTSLCEYALDRALYNLNKLDGYTKSKNRGDRVHMRIMAQQDWGPAMSLVSNFIEECRRYTDKNIVVIAHEHQQTTESGHVTYRSPQVIGRVLRQDLPKQFDEVWRMEKDNDGTPVLITQGTSKFQAGSRLGLPDRMEKPTYQKILKHVQKAA